MSGMKAFMLKYALKYDALLKSDTMKTSAVSTAILYAIGDYCTQIFVER